MTTNEMKSTGEALIALSEGKHVEYLNNEGNWLTDYAGYLDLKIPPVRIKPATTKRLIRAEDLNSFPVIWVRVVRTAPWFLVTAISNIGEMQLSFGNEGYVKGHPISMLAKMDYEWSPDRIQVRSFWVEG